MREMKMSIPHGRKMGLMQNGSKKETKMKSYILAVLSLLIVFLAANPCFAEDNNGLSGTWEGILYIADLDIDMEIVLVLEEKNGALTGRISDDWGYLNGDIIDPAFERDTLTFEAFARSSQGDRPMVFRMTVGENEMRGEWNSLGSSGDWILAKKKAGEKTDRKEFKIRDVVGVWEGPAAYKSDPGSKNILTLILEEREGEPSVAFSDQFGNNYDRVVIESFEANKLLLEIGFILVNESYLMELDIEVRNESYMRGKFSIEKMGRTGIWTAQKRR
jgi:hypothetical protein